MDFNTPFSSDESVGLSEQEKRLTREPIQRKKVLVIAGPTATGKTELSMIIAKALGSEIISCDSMQLYRNTDIGTAKVTKCDRLQVPHHLIDIRDIHEPFNVVDFYNEATAALEEILLRDRVPIAVGGAGFYIHTLLYGPPKGPPADVELRTRLEEDIEKFGPEMLFQKLKECDPDYASTITIQDRHKIVRALEIIMLTGKKVSEIPKPSQEDLSRELDFRCWFIHYPKEILYPRIEERCEQMLRMGLMEEVICLREKGLENNPSAANSIGYRQCLRFLQTAQTEEDWNECVREFKRASRNYAKRQFTWFRREPLFRWLNLGECTVEHAAEIIIQDLEQN